MTEDDAGLAERVVRTGENEIELRLTAREQSILAALLDDLETVLTPPPTLGHRDDAATEPEHDVPLDRDLDDAVRARLYPSAAPHDERIDASFRRLVQADLESGRRARLAIVRATLGADTIDDRQADAWLHALNDVRLVMGTRLEVTEETEAQPPDARDPDAAATMIYAYVGWLLEQFVDVLASSLPEPGDAADDPPEPFAPGGPDESVTEDDS